MSHFPSSSELPAPRAHSAPQPKSRLNYLLSSPPPPLSTLSLSTLPSPFPPLPSLLPPPQRARSADTALPPIPPLSYSPPPSPPVPKPASPQQRLPSGVLRAPAASLKALSSKASPRLQKTEAELRDKRELRRMKNRISAARSRQRKTDSFESLQRELAEAKNVIQALTLQLESVRGAGIADRDGVPIAVPHDLRRAVGRDFVSADALMDLLRYYVHQDPRHNMNQRVNGR